MASHTSSPTLSWESQLDRRFEFAKFCWSTKNSPLLNDTIANEIADQTDHVAAIRVHCCHRTDQTKALTFQIEMIHINSRFVNTVKKQLECLLEKCETLALDWRWARDHYNFDDLISAVTGVGYCALEKAKQDSKAAIDKLPWGARPHASQLSAKLISVGASYYLEMHHLMDDIRDILDKKDNGSCPDGLKAAVRKALTTNKTGAKSTMSLMESWVASKGHDDETIAMGNIREESMENLAHSFCNRNEDDWEICGTGQ